MTSVRVPGKVMLSGEYAVLHGGTAALITVPRHFSISESAFPESQLQTPVIKAALRQPIEETAQYERKNGLPNLSFDPSEFFSEDFDGKLAKLGLGLSAAEAVGVVALRFERAGLGWSENREKIAEYAARIHSEVQGGRGSGADVIACAYGEPVKFRRDEDGYSVEPIHPSGKSVPLHLVWTGQPADTRQMVEGFNGWLLSHGQHAAGLLSELVESSHRAADAWFTSLEDVLFACLDRFCSALQACMEAAELRHKLPIHYELEDWARDHGGRAKPTGAGGGDMILLIGSLPVEKLDMMVMRIDG